MKNNNYPNMSKNHNPYDQIQEEAHYNVFELLRRDQGVSLDEIIAVAPRSKSEANARMYITNFRREGRNSKIIIKLINGRYYIKDK